MSQSVEWGPTNPFIRTWFGVRVIRDTHEPGWWCLGINRFWGSHEECQTALAIAQSQRFPGVRYEVQPRRVTDAEWTAYLDGRRLLSFLPQA